MAAEEAFEEEKKEKNLRLVAFNMTLDVMINQILK